MNISEMILQAIGTGEKNAANVEQLSMITGLNDRELRKAVEGLRRDGYVIISSEMILQAIGTGEKNAANVEQLSMITGLNDRELRKAVEGLRRDGYVIISSESGAGV